MCILFIYNGSNDPESDYRLVVATNRDEFYHRPAKNLAPWSEDPSVIGGRDLEAGCDGGTWLALSPLRKKLGVLLNLPTAKSSTAKTRGKLVADFVKSEAGTNDYIESMKSYGKECNNFVLVTIDLRLSPSVQTYTNATDTLSQWEEPYLGFGNSLPESPLKKVVAGKLKLKDTCSRFKKISDKNRLMQELLELLKWNEKHLPDPELQRSRPDNLYKELSSVYVAIPEGGYGTRTHTIILVTKTGHVDVTEVSMQPPMDTLNPKWERTEMQFQI